MLTLAFRFSFPNVNFEPEMDFVAGDPKDYGAGVDERWKNAFGVWMVKQDGKLVALSNICTHLGCIPNWLPAELKFKCPCHGSGYYMSGVNFEGPAPRPLERVALRLASDGMLEVDKSFKFQEEKGQWEDAKSFVDASLV